jgi:hypothetical protein
MKIEFLKVFNWYETLNSFGKVLILKSHNKQQKRIDMGEFYF